MSASIAPSPPPDLLPPYGSAQHLTQALGSSGHTVIDPGGFAALLDVPLAQLVALGHTWDDLPPDAYLRDGGRYRRRRHACYVIDGSDVQTVPHRAHWQPVEYNALHGGLERWFEPVGGLLAASAPWTRILQVLAEVCSTVKGSQPWYVEAHQFRIDTTDGIGRPTPEGAHRDGVDFVAVILVDRVGVKGGETRVFDAQGPHGVRFTMTEPWTLLMLDDARMIHETTPIQPADLGGHRDTLVLTFRAGGFQGPIDGEVPPPEERPGNGA